jgi:hypothetical protein
MFLRLVAALDEKGRIFVDRDGTHFGSILNWLRMLQLPADMTTRERETIMREADFYGLGGLMEALQNSHVRDEVFSFDVVRLMTIKAGKLLEIGCGNETYRSAILSFSFVFNRAPHMDTFIQAGNFDVSCRCPGVVRLHMGDVSVMLMKTKNRSEIEGGKTFVEACWQVV